MRKGEREREAWLAWFQVVVPVKAAFQRHRQNLFFSQNVKKFEQGRDRDKTKSDRQLTTSGGRLNFTSGRKNRNGCISRISDSSNGILWIIHRRHFVTLADLSKGAKFGFRFIENRCLQIHRMVFEHIYRMTWVDSSNGKVPNWFEVPSLSASTWKIMEMSNNILLTSTIFRVLVII